MKLSDQIHRLFHIPFRLHVEHDSGGEGHTVVFLHGIASDSLGWGVVLNKLPKRYRAITIDILGFGSSPKPSWLRYSLEDHVKSVAKTIKAEKIGPNITLVGHSLGALIAIELANKYPELIKQLVLVSPPIYDTEKLSGGTQIINKANLLITNTLFQIYEILLQRKDFTISSATRIIKLITKEAGFTISEDNWLPFQKSLTESIMQQTSLGSLSRVSIPTVIIFGTLDALIISKNYQKAASQNGNIKIKKFLGGHFINSKAAQLIIDNLD